MKITSSGATIYSISEAREARTRTDGEGGQQGGPGYQRQPKKEDGKDAETFEETLSEQKVAEAAVLFGAENVLKGLSASVEGNGPGLKVTLKDGKGAIVRQFTGEEFMKLREAATQDGRKSGKILDQKL